MTTLEDRKAELLKRLRALDVRLHVIEDELDAPRSKDWEDAAVEREGDEVLETLGLSGEAEIARIQAALKRIEEGTYGECVSCGEPISEARLDVLPDAPLCKTCAAGRAQQ